MDRRDGVMIGLQKSGVADEVIAKPEPIAVFGPYDVRDKEGADGKKDKDREKALFHGLGDFLLTEESRRISSDRSIIVLVEYMLEEPLR